VLAQLAGAVVAAVCLAALFPDEVTLAALGTPALAPKITALKGILIEGLITFVFVAVILAVTRDDNHDRSFAGLAIGGTLVAVILFAGPLTGAGANPARFFGPALISGNLRESFVYVIGPILGAGLAALLMTPLLDPAGEGSAEDDPAAETMPGEKEEPVKRPTSPKSIQTALKRAHDLFVAGSGEEAAAVLLPYLPKIRDYESEVFDRIRSLVIVIEEEHGRIRGLDEYREAIYASKALRST
jgi:hypothetical protein